VHYAVDAGPAVFRLEMLPEDEHSQRVFTSYGAALRYAREHKLPSMPSASLVLATCSASDLRLQAALEMALDGDPQMGRAVLLRRWLDAVVISRNGCGTMAATSRRRRQATRHRPAAADGHSIWAGGKGVPRDRIPAIVAR